MAVSKEIIVNEETLTCSICLELFDKPRTLPCLHSFCHECLIGYIAKTVQNHEGKQDIHCPLCRADTHTDIKLFDRIEKWVESLPVNFMLFSILSDSKNRMAEEISYCGPCLREETKVPAVIHCLECAESLCENCRKFHQKMKSLSIHKVYNLCDGKIDTEKFDFLKSLTQCPEHVTEDVRYICKDHDQLCCNECAIVKHRKCDHMVSLADEIAELKNTEQETKKRLEEIKHEAEKMIQYEKEHESSVRASVANVEEKLVKIKNLIDEAYLKMKQAITCEVAEKSGNVLKLSAMQIDGIENLKSEVDHSGRKLDFVFENGEKVHLFLVGRKLKMELTRYDAMLQKLHKGPSVKNISVIENIAEQDLVNTIASCFHIGEETSSNLKDMEPVVVCEEKTLLPSGKAGSCVWIDNYLVVALQDSNQIHLFDVVDKTIKYNKTKTSSTEHRSVAKIDDSRFVICFPKTKTIEIMKIAEGVFETQKIIETCNDVWDVCFDEFSSDIICLSRAGSIDCYTRDGIKSRSLSLTPMILDTAKNAYSVCFDSKRQVLYISCHGLHKLLAVRLNGVIVFEYNSTEVKYPWYVDLDRDGNIYLPFFSLDGGSGVVHQIDSTEKLIRAIKLPGRGASVSFDRTKTKFVISCSASEYLVLMYHLK